jgi:Flp pilus assembly protein TadG
MSPAPQTAGSTALRVTRRLLRTPSSVAIAIVYVVTRTMLVLIPFGFFPYPRGTLIAADIRQYWVWADVIGTGQFPVNDPMWQYPPLAGFIFWIGQLVSVRPLLGFVMLALIVDATIFAILLRKGLAIRDRLRSEGAAEPNSGLLGAWFYVLAGAAIGPVLLTRFDIFPTLLAVLALLVVTKPVRSGVLLGIGALLKVWPAFLIIALPRRGFSKGIAALAVTGIVGLSAALMFGPHAFSFVSGQGGRGVQVESVGGLGYLVAQMLGVNIESGMRYGSVEVSAVGTTLIGTGLTLLGLAAIGVLAWLRLRGRLDRIAPADIALTIVLILIATSRVLSPQFMIWAAGVAAICLLSARTLMRPIAGLILFVSVLGQVIYPLGYKALLTGDVVMTLVQTARISALVAAAVWAFVRITRRGRSAQPPQSLSTNTGQTDQVLDDPLPVEPSEPHRDSARLPNPVRAAGELIANRMRMSRLSEDRGAVLVTASIVMVPLMLGSAAIGVDASNWYYMGQRLQVAADAAALAGAVYMPGDFNEATSAARVMSGLNGFTHDPYSANVNQRVTVTPEASAKASELRVTVTATKSNWFGWALSRTDQTMSRTAVAEYRGPVLMGSPCNLFGDEPPGGTPAWESASTSEACNTTPEFWANVAGPGAKKSYGDRYATRRCDSGNSGCTNQSNDNYAPTGHFYKISVKEPVTSISVEIFDPALVHVGDYCETSSLPSTWSKDTPNPYSTIP